MLSHDNRFGRPGHRDKISRKDVKLARAELAAGGLSHREQRLRRTITRNWEFASRRRRQERRHLIIALLSGVAAVAVIGAALGIGPAIEAATGSGTTGEFIVGYHVCSARFGCTWVGTFEAPGQVVPGVAYEGTLSAGTGPGSRIQVRYPGDHQAYAAHGSHTWVWDLLTMSFVGSATGFVVWLSPVGLRERRNASATRTRRRRSR
jgi:hypothetical protein